eukprot:TRINITY_DN2511_c0_g1_i8.p2 TRINITY_DN2511_c0_g1~~TRINITY_DN2511_c0_g1_i8.p2  ORF type:complete len:143 (+),score=48.40 TRINITY_DN2511_c0_g1_i8:283-711(+)
MIDVISVLGESRLNVHTLEALASKANLIECTEDAALEGLIFEKLGTEEAGALSLMEERKREEDARVAKEGESDGMPLKDKVLGLHKMVYDPSGEVLALIKYTADPETGKLIRDGHLSLPKEDPFGIDEGTMQYEDFYENSSK